LPSGERSDCAQVNEKLRYIEVRQGSHKSVVLSKLLQFARTDGRSMARGVADRQGSVLPVPVEKRIVEKQTSKQKTHDNLPRADGLAAVCGLRNAHLTGFHTSTLNSIPPAVKRMPGLPREEVGIIARGAMIPVVGSITEVQTGRVSARWFTSE